MILIWFLHLLNNALSLREYTKRRMWTLNWGRAVQGTGHGLLQILAQHLPGKTENNYKKVNEDRSPPGLQPPKIS